jgi:diaminopropionate ammonia-lyase
MKNEAIKYIINNRKTKNANVSFLDKENIDTVRAFHKKFPLYEMTNLHSLSNISKEFGVDKIWVKDESTRFNLNAFKVLGGSYAIGKYLSEKLDMNISDITFEMLKSEDIKRKLGEIIFVSATDGNHGRGIAWAANALLQKSVIFMPKGSSQYRLKKIIDEGATASITDYNYDDAVRLASEYANDNNGVLIQDSSWEGYTKIPTWIMQGYATLIDEALEQIENNNDDYPTHVFLQAGVGSFAGSILGYLVSKFGKNKPIVAIIEPNEAACIYKSANENDGNPHNVTGFMPTIMAGLACGEPSLVAWEILRDYSDVYISCPDNVSARGMRILSNPIYDDQRIISGESGAVGMGLLSLIMTDKSLESLKKDLKIDKNSRILIISTEGDTDPKSYQEIVWDGKYPSGI